MNNDGKLFIAKGLKRIPLLYPLARRYNKRRHTVIGKQVEHWCASAARQLEGHATVTVPNDGPIWVLWWQGVETAPAIVRACIASMERNAGGRKVVVITRDNVQDYVDMPELIFEKMASHAITLTHFSDILRFNLLHRYGGLWMDATLLVSSSLDETRCFGSFFTCSGFVDPTHFFVTKGKWTGFFIGGSSSEPLFAFMDAFFQTYWEHNDQLVDYFLIDYALDYAYEHDIGSLREWVQTQYGKDNPHLFDLAPIIADSFDPQVWKQLTADTNVFKLSWKKPKTYPAGSYGACILNQQIPLQLRSDTDRNNRN